MKICILGRSGKMGSAIEALTDHSVVDIEEADVIVDVSHPDALCLCDTPYIVGSTGHGPENFAAMERQAKKSPVLYAPNFSLGIALVNHFLKMIKQRIEINSSEITDIHHTEKRDMPSGTALMLSKLLNNPSINSIREKDVVGEHRILLNFDDEDIEIRHKAHSRKAFARGALNAIDWIVDQKPGLYSMEDVLCSALK
ncbi:MAG: hypothetical protein KDK50_03275 [Chlamydiia bacterium]|nr:hypothetical protein [Chlamydiia bacterium]